MEKIKHGIKQVSLDWGICETERSDRLGIRPSQKNKDCVVITN
jgi:hypothetical protein